MTVLSGDRHGAPARVGGERDLYQEIRRSGLQSQVWQWQSFATFCQYRRVFETTRRHVRPGAVALDWGCGNGHFSYFLVRQDVQSVGYSFDAAPPLLAGDGRFQHRRGDPSEPVRLPFADEAFDVVFSVGVLEHVHEFGGDARGSIRELERVLKPGGHFLCFHLPNRYGWSENLRKVMRRLGSKVEAHPVLYTARTFGDLLRGTRLSVVEARRYGFLPRTCLSDLPAVLRDAATGVAFLNGLDVVLERLFSPLCQNWSFVVVKQPGGAKA